jgi:hypothetical protein
LVTNYSGLDTDDYQKALFPKFGKLVSSWDFEPELFVGSIDSILELNPINAEKAFMVTGKLPALYGTINARAVGKEMVNDHETSSTTEDWRYYSCHWGFEP